MTNMGIGGYLTFDVNGALGNMKQASHAFGTLSAAAGAFKNKVMSVATSVLTLGGPLGQLASVAGIGMLANSAMRAKSEFEDMQTVLATTLSVVGNTDMSTGLKVARQEMEKIEELAVKAPGGAQDLLQIYKQIVSPISVAGKSLNDVRDMTLSAAIAGQSLGLNFQDMGFGLGKMLSGTIQQDDLFYKMLRGMGLIKMGSMEWNAQTPVERIQKANELMAKFGKASDTVGNTWTAIKSTFGDVMTITQREFISPLFDAMRDTLGKINQTFLDNKDAVKAWAAEAGKNLIPVFHNVIAFLKGAWAVFQSVKPFIVDVFTFLGGMWNGISKNISDALSPLKGVWDELWASLKLLWSEIMALFGMANDSVAEQGEGIGNFVMAVVKGIATMVSWVAKAISFVVYFAAHIRYAFEVVGTRIGEVFGAIYITIVNMFKGVYNAITQPIRDALNFVASIIEGLNSTAIGKKAFEGVGWDAGKTVTEIRHLTSGSGALGAMQYDALPDFAHVETPEERLRKAEAKRGQQQPVIKVENKVNMDQQIDFKVNGKNIAEAVVKAQTEVKERAGANDTPWQRRAAVVNAAPAPGR